MPVFLNRAPVGVSTSQEPLSGIMADSYGVSGTTNPSAVGIIIQAATVDEWTIAVNTPLPSAGAAVIGYLRYSQTDVHATQTFMLKSERTAKATITPITFNAVFPSPIPFLSDDCGVHYTAPGLAATYQARAALKYTLTPDFNSALVGGGRLEAMIAKSVGSAGVYAVPGTPMTGRITQTVEANAQVPWPSRGTFTGITVVAYSSSVTSGGASPQFPTRFTLRVAGADTALTATASGTGKLYSTAASVPVAFGDLVSLRVQALSFAAGSYFHGWCELAWLPALADPPAPPPVAGPAPSAMTLGQGFQELFADPTAGQWFPVFAKAFGAFASNAFVDGLPGVQQVAETMVPRPTTFTSIAMRMHTLSDSACSLKLSLMVNSQVQALSVVGSATPGVYVGTGTINVASGAFVTLVGTMGAADPLNDLVDFTYSVGYRVTG